MIIYLDSEFKCHVTNDGAMMEIQTDYFDGKCDAYIEGYRFIPYGCTWTRKDGVECTGEMIVPWMDIRDLKIAQLEYENAVTQANLTDAQENNDMLTDCILEMSSILYA